MQSTQPAIEKTIEEIEQSLQDIKRVNLELEYESTHGSLRKAHQLEQQRTYIGREIKRLVQELY